MNERKTTVIESPLISSEQFPLPTPYWDSKIIRRAKLADGNFVFLRQESLTKYTLLLWDAKENKPIKEKEFEADLMRNTLIFHPQKNRIILCGKEGSLKIIYPVSFEIEQEIPLNSGQLELLPKGLFVCKMRDTEFGEKRGELTVLDANLKPMGTLVIPAEKPEKTYFYWTTLSTCEVVAMTQDAKDDTWAFVWEIQDSGLSQLKIQRKLEINDSIAYIYALSNGQVGMRFLHAPSCIWNPRKADQLTRLNQCFEFITSIDKDLYFLYLCKIGYEEEFFLWNKNNPDQPLLIKSGETSRSKARNSQLFLCNVIYDAAFSQMNRAFFAVRRESCVLQGPLSYCKKGTLG